MKKLGIVFGCFDFVVTPDDQYFFLEVNEMGQFLWIENLLPELHLLNKFCDFLLSDITEKNENSGGPIKLNEIRNTLSYQNLIKEDFSEVNIHVTL